MKNKLKIGWGNGGVDTDCIDQISTTRTTEKVMRFEEIQDEVRKRYPGTTIINLKTTPEDVYLLITYDPLNVEIKVPYCNNIDILCESYVQVIITKLNILIEYNNSKIRTLKHTISSFKSTLNTSTKTEIHGL